MVLKHACGASAQVGRGGAGIKQAQSAKRELNHIFSRIVGFAPPRCVQDKSPSNLHAACLHAAVHAKTQVRDAVGCQCVVPTLSVCLQVYLFGGAVCSWKQASGDEVLYVRPDAVFDKVSY